MYKATMLFSVLIFAASLCGTVGGQTENQPGRQNVQPQTTSKTQTERPMDQFFAAKMVLCNNGEIDAGKLASTKASNSEVKQFAEMLVRDHSAMNQQLKPLVPDYATPPVTSATQTSDESPEKSGIAKSGVEPASPNQAPTRGDAPPRVQKETSLRTDASTETLRDLYEVCEKANHYLRQDCREKLMKLTGSDFDKAYMIGQVAGHSMALAELQALESSTTGEFQNIVRQTKTKIENHLETAERICKTLEAEQQDTSTNRSR
jgi:predicted outer membrane protein